MLLLAAYQGLRAHEIAKVHSSDFDLERDTMVVQGKGSRTDTLPLHPLVADKARQLAQRGWWFPSQRGGPISGRWVSTVVARELRKIGIDATAHWLRHWFGTTLVRGKVDIRSVQALMRHESLQTTSRYIKANEQGLADALTELPSLIANKPPIDQSDRVPIRRQA
jgi:integrase